MKKPLFNRIVKLERLFRNSLIKNESRISCYRINGDTINANDDDDIFEILLNKVTHQLGISESAFEEIMSAIHNDMHSPRLPAIVNRIIENGFGEIPNKILYRGCSEVEYNNITNSGTAGISKCLSFSESKQVALTFGKRLLSVKFEIPIFPYHKLYRYYYNTLKNSLSEYGWEEFDQISEATETLALATRESEWIAPDDTVFTLNDDGTFTASFKSKEDSEDLLAVKAHLNELCNQLKLDDYDLDDVYSGNDSCNIHGFSISNLSTKASRILSSNNVSSFHIHYTYDSSEVSFFIPGLGILEKVVDNITKFNKTKFCNLIADMIKSAE